jgi:hypothetical protein
VKAERFAFQFPTRFFFLLWRVKAAFERLDVSSSSYEYSSSWSSSGRLNLSLLLVSATMDGVRDFIVGPFSLLCHFHHGLFQHGHD